MEMFTRYSGLHFGAILEVEMWFDLNKSIVVAVLSVNTLGNAR